jgi:transposase-like protein
MLRREHLYGGQLRQLRLGFAQHGVEGLSKSLPGPASRTTPEQRKIAQLEKDNARLNRKLQIAEDCLDLQKSLGDARTHEHRERCMKQVIDKRAQRVPLAQACRALGLNRGSVYARRKRLEYREQPRTARINTRQPRALSPAERQNVLEMLHSQTFADQPPAEVYSQLLEQGQYLCSVSTMHRVLRDAKENGERRVQRPAQTPRGAAMVGPPTQ